MPIYEYRCLDCDHEFEQMQKFSDPPIDACPSCSGSVKKLISRSAFHLKGDGWYVTDYARKGSQNGSSSSSSDEKTKESEPSKSKDTAASKDTSSSNTSASSTTADAKSS